MTDAPKLISRGKRIFEALGPGMLRDITLQLKPGKYMPHQGARECARRLRQAKHGRGDDVQNSH